MKYYKTIPFIRNGIKQIKSNKGRFFLTVSGTVISTKFLLLEKASGAISTTVWPSILEGILVPAGAVVSHL